MSENSLESTLIRHGLQRKDLKKECSREVMVIMAIKAPVDCKTLGRYLAFDEEKLAEIEQKYDNEEKRKEVLLDEMKGQGRSYLFVADSLCRQQRPDLLDLLCGIIKSTSKSELDRDLHVGQVDQFPVEGNC